MEPPNAAPVDARGLRLRHASGRVGLDGVDLAVAPGERLAVLGANGSGKSTLLRVLATALRPDAGSLRILGFDGLRPSPALRRKLGVAFDRAPHLDALPGRENARLFARAGGVGEPEAGRRADALLDRWGLSEAAGDPAGAWSFGMRRKLLLAQAFVHRPSLLVLDEPTVGLDPPSLDTLVALAAERAADGAALVAATNDPVSAARLADRVVFLDAGRVVADDAPAALLAALPGGTRVELEPTRPGPPPRGLGLRLEVGEEGRWSARLPGGPSELPGLLAALLEGGVALRTVRLREPDLGDVFREVTGRPLGREAPR